MLFTREPTLRRKAIILQLKTLKPDQTVPQPRRLSLQVDVPLVERVLRKKAGEGGKDSIRGREGWESKGLISQLA